MLLGAVIVGAVNVQLVDCVLLLYTAGKVHVLSAVLLNVFPFAFHLAVNIIASFLNIAYNVTLLVFIFKEDNFVVASLFVFHPTNVHPDFVAVGVKSIAAA